MQQQQQQEQQQQQQQQQRSGSKEFWLFGYGSAVDMRRIFEYTADYKDRRIPGYVKGYVRRFWQASEDHRGTPEAPGRVVTLIERLFWETLDDHYTRPEELVWGAAYRIEASKVVEVQDYLDIREMNGYSIQYAPFYPSGPEPSPFECLVYIGMPDNPQFMGVQEPQALAEHIFRSEGPSGKNMEYLLALEHALAGLGPGSGDAHVEDLATRLRRLQAKVISLPTAEVKDDAVSGEARKMQSAKGTDEQEEVEHVDVEST